MTNVYVYAGDVTGCGSYRMIWPAAAVAAHTGWNVEVILPGDRRVEVGVGLGGKVHAERFPEDADVVVLQRPTLYLLTEMIPLAQARGVAVVVDMDDDLGAIHPSNPAFGTLRAKLPHPIPELRRRGETIPNPHRAQHAARACALADVVTVTTPRLAKVYANHHGGAVVVANRVPERYLAVEHVDSDLVGWGGSVHSHPDDLQTVGAGVADVVRARGRFGSVGMPDGVAAALGIDDPVFGLELAGPVSIEEWPSAIARFGVGIAPLADTVFNHAKSWLKPLEYNAVGVPCVASPSPDYVAWSHLSGGGTVLARRPREWSGILRALVKDPGRRAEMSAAGRAAAAENTIEGHAWRWAEAWRLAVETRARRLSRAMAGAT